MNSPSTTSLFFTTSSQSKTPSLFKQGAAAWVPALDKESEQVLSSLHPCWRGVFILQHCMGMQHFLTPQGFAKKSHSSVCVLTSVLLGPAPALPEVQQLCETYELMDSVFLLCSIKGGSTKTSSYAKACSWIQSSYSVLHPLLPPCRAGMCSPVCREQLCMPVNLCTHVGEHGWWASHPLTEVYLF